MEAGTMFRQTKTLWALIVALGLVAALLTTCRKDETVHTYENVHNLSGSSDILLEALGDDTVRLFIRGSECGEPEWPPCFIGSLPADSLNYSFVLSHETSEVDSSIAIVRLQIDATFRVPRSQ